MNAYPAQTNVSREISDVLNSPVVTAAYWSVILFVVAFHLAYRTLGRG